MTCWLLLRLSFKLDFFGAYVIFKYLINVTTPLVLGYIAAQQPVEFVKPRRVKSDPIGKSILASDLYL